MKGKSVLYLSLFYDTFWYSGDVLIYAVSAELQIKCTAYNYM